MYEKFNFTEKIGSNKKYDAIDDVEVIKKFAKKIKEEFEWHIHEDHSNHPHLKKEPCSYVNYTIHGEVMFRQTSMIPKNELPQEYFIFGDRVQIYIKNIRPSKEHNLGLVGIEGYVNLSNLNALVYFKPIISMIERLCEGKQI